jgi:hypothetical protein
MIPFIFSHLGIFFAYHTTFYSTFSTSFLPTTATTTLENTDNQVNTLARNAFQKQIQVHNVASQSGLLKIYTFLYRA